MLNIDSGCVCGMEYAAFGSGERNVIVLPGLSDGLATVKGKALALVPPYIPFLKKFRIYMFSRRNGLERGFSIRDMAIDQLAALRELCIGEYCVLGVSQGGMIASELALADPEGVRKLVLAVTSARANDTVRENIMRWLSFARTGDHAALMRDTAEKSYTEGYLRAMRMLYPVLGLIGKPKDYLRFIANCEAILGFDACERLGGIRCPTLIIGGGKDSTVGAEAAYELHGLIPHSELFVYPDLGHGLYEESGDFYLRVFRYFEG